MDPWSVNVQTETKHEPHHRPIVCLTYLIVKVREHNLQCTDTGMCVRECWAENRLVARHECRLSQAQNAPTYGVPVRLVEAQMIAIKTVKINPTSTVEVLQPQQILCELVAVQELKHGVVLSVPHIPTKLL